MADNKIIVEGIDGAGKSTYINKIVSNSNIKYKVIHCTRHTPNNFEYFKKLLESDDNIIFDRSFIGQFIYQTRDERIDRNLLSDLERLEIENIVNRNTHSTVIYVYSDINKCLYNCMKDSEDSYYNKQYLQELDMRYRYFFKYISSLSNVNYYYNDYEIDDKQFSTTANYTDITVKDFNFSSLPYIIAVDFDGVLSNDCFPYIENAKPNIKLINELKTRKNNGEKIVLWTCRTGEALIEACNFCADYGLYFDAINDNIKEVRDNLDGGPRKIYADLYIDDKAKVVKFLG